MSADYITLQKQYDALCERDTQLVGTIVGLQGRLNDAEDKLRQFGIEWEEGKGYVFNGRDMVTSL